MKYLDHIGVLYRVEEAEGDTYATLSQQYGVTVPLTYNEATKKGMVGYSIPKLREIVL